MSELLRKVYCGAVVKDGTLKDREIRVTASDPTPDRVGDVMEPKGCVLDSYVENNIVLADHDPRSAIGNAEIQVSYARVSALITFAPKGISVKADEYCGLYKAGVLRAVSVGFEPIECEPIKNAGVRYTKWALLELSCVAVPANANALVVARSATAARSRPKPLADLSERERRELDIRQSIRAKGPLIVPKGAALAAWLEQEFPEVGECDGLDIRRQKYRDMTLHERFMERLRESEFAKRHAQIDEIRSQIRAEIKELMDLPSPSTAPLYGASAAEWCANVRAADEARIRDALRKWRS